MDKTQILADVLVGLMGLVFLWFGLNGQEKIHQYALVYSGVNMGYLVAFYLDWKEK